MKNLMNILWLLTFAACLQAQSLRVFAIDVEGGKSTLFVSQAGQSMLVDAGYDDRGGRDAERIVAAAKAAGIRQIDYLTITHYHHDHVGGVPQLAARIPILNWHELLVFGRHHKLAIARVLQAETLCPPFDTALRVRASGREWTDCAVSHERDACVRWISVDDHSC